MIVDYVRSCYRTDMVFRAGDDPVPVEWHFVKPGAGLFPGWNAFTSANWDSRQLFAGDLGEQPGSKPWRRGNQLPYGSSTYNCFTQLPWFDTGIPSGEHTGPVNPDGSLACCEPTDQSCCPGLGSSVTLTIPPGDGCPCLDGQSCVLNKTAFNKWQGGFQACGGQGFGFTLTCEGDTVNDWYLAAQGEIIGIAPKVRVLAGASCSPLLLVFSPLDWPNPSIYCDGSSVAVITP